MHDMKMLQKAKDAVQQNMNEQKRNLQIEVDENKTQDCNDA